MIAISFSPEPVEGIITDEPSDTQDGMGECKAWVHHYARNDAVWRLSVCHVHKE